MVSRDVEIALQDVKDLRKLTELAWEDGEIQNRVIGSLYIRAMIRGNDAFTGLIKTVSSCFRDLKAQIRYFLAHEA